MSPKELLYLEDALGHEKYLKTQSLDVASKLEDKQLKELVDKLVKKHEKLYKHFYQIL